MGVHLPIAKNATSALTTKLAKSGADILTGPINLNPATAILVGTTDNGLYLGNTGIVGRKAAATTFSVAADGTATFAGALSAATGTFAGVLTAGAVNAVDTINLRGESISSNYPTTVAENVKTSGGTSLLAVVGSDEVWPRGRRFPVLAEGRLRRHQVDPVRCRVDGFQTEIEPVIFRLWKPLLQGAAKCRRLGQVDQAE